MKLCKNKKGSSVVQLLILIAIFGTLAIIMLSKIAHQMTSKANNTTITLLESERTDVDKLVHQ